MRDTMGHGASSRREKVAAFGATAKITAQSGVVAATAAAAWTARTGRKAAK